MSRKDYIKMAALFAEQRNKADAEAVLADLIWGYCDIAENDNPLFDRRRFIAACRK